MFSLLTALAFSTTLTRTTSQIISPITTPSLNLTAIATRNGTAVFECWQLSPFRTSAGAGTVGALNLALGGLGNGTYTVLPPRFDGGLHRAPANQYVVFLSGLAHLTLPNFTDEAWVYGGKYGMIIAADTASTYGHITTYPGAAITTAVQIPWTSGTVPEHVVLHGGACLDQEIIGI